MSFNLVDYLPILLMFVVAAGFAVTFIGLSQLVGQRKRTRTKLMPYECGKDPVGSARERFSVKKPVQLGRGQLMPSEIGRVVLQSG